ncbi:MAG: dihydrodipicolinate synthase family protein [Actinomycetes bacterium]
MSKARDHAGSGLRGIVGASLTPFRDDGTVDVHRLCELVEFMAGHCDAVSVLGAEVSEYQVLSPRERRSVLVEGLGAAQGRVRTLAGASSPSVGEVVELSEIAADAGADLIQVLMPLRPWGGQPSERDLVAYYEAVTARAALPVVAYHNPGRGADPTPPTMVRISEIDGVVAFKESSRDISRIGRLVTEIELSGNANYCTTMQPLLATLELGGSGAMMPPPATLIAREIARAFDAGDRDAAARWQRGFTLFPSRWGSYGLAPVMKAAMRQIGIDLGQPAAPYAPVSESDAEEIGAALRDAGLFELLDLAVSR